MPSFSIYKNQILGNTVGTIHKSESDLIMEATWDNDIATRDMYFYDYYHDDHKNQLSDLHPENDKNKIMMRCKYLTYTSQTLDKDAINYHLQMKPSQDCVVPYYDELIGKRYDGLYPCGLYVDIQDSKGVWNKWLVVTGANINDPQFPTFELLRCDYVLQYIFNNTKYEISSVTRSQNSYNKLLRSIGIC